MEPIKLVQKILTLSPHFFNAIPNIFCLEDDFITTRNAYYLFYSNDYKKGDTQIVCNDLAEKIFSLKNLFVSHEKIFFNSLSLYDPMNSTTISKWKDVSITQEEGEYYLVSGFKEIHKEIWETIETLNENEKIELKIQVNETMEEFVFVELTKGCGNVSLIKQILNVENSIFNKFSDEIRLVEYEISFVVLIMIYCWPLDKSTLDVEESEGFIQNMKTAITTNELPLHILKTEKYKFQEFDLSIVPNPSVDGESNSRSLLFEFKKEVKTEEFRLETFSYFCLEKEEVANISKYELKKDTNSSTDTNHALPTYTFISSKKEVPHKLFKIEEKEEHIKLTLTRPKGDDNTNSLKEEDGLTIKCISGSICRKPVEVTVNGKDKIKGDYIETTFIIKKSKEKTSGEYVLHDSFKNKLGLFEISINGENGVIGKYAILMQKNSFFAIYNNQPFSIPFPPCESETVTHLIETKDISNKATIICITILAAIVITRGIFMVMLRHYWG